MDNRNDRFVTLSSETHPKDRDSPLVNLRDYVATWKSGSFSTPAPRCFIFVIFCVFVTTRREGVACEEERGEEEASCGVHVQVFRGAAQPGSCNCAPMYIIMFINT